MITPKTSKADTVFICNPAAVRDILQRKSAEPIRWERRFSTADTAHDVDLKELAAAVKCIKGSRGFRFTDTKNIDTVLNDLSLGKHGRLTQGGDVVFGKEPSKRMPPATLANGHLSILRNPDIAHVLYLKNDISK